MNKRKSLLVVLIILVIIAGSYFLYDNSPNYYEIPHTLEGLKEALSMLDTEWEVEPMESSDEDHLKTYRLNSISDSNVSLALSSMSKDNMTNIFTRQIFKESIDEYLVEDALKLMCELSGITNYRTAYSEFNQYLSKRDRNTYGDTAWHFASNDKMLIMNCYAQHPLSDKYEVNSIWVMNSDFFKQRRMEDAIKTTQTFEKSNLPIIKDTLVSDLPTSFNDDQRMYRVIVFGELSEVGEAKSHLVGNVMVEDKDQPLYLDDYFYGFISDDTGRISVLLPKYVIEYNDYKSINKTWHITYYPPSDLYLVDYGF